MRRLRIYSDRSLVPAGEPHVVALFPFWGREEGVERPRPGYADRLIEEGQTLFELTDLASAEIAVFPQDWSRIVGRPERVAAAEAFAAQALAAGAEPVFFYRSDKDDPIPIDGITVFRTSFHRSRRGPREFAHPPFHEDLLERTGGELLVQESPGVPRVGFCGVALRDKPPAGAIARVRRRAGDVRRAFRRRRGEPLPEDLFVRSRALDELRRQDRVEADIVLRDEVYGGAVFPELDMDVWERVRQEYVENIVGSDYVLCVRGVGNFSFRFSETLCLGRIPVFVDTDCPLPYDFLVNWRDHCVWIDRSELRQIGAKVAAFHTSLSERDLVARQHECRRLWEEYLSPEGFFRNFHLHFRDGAAV